MDITTEPQYLEKEVLQLDFVFLGSTTPLPLTLEVTDSIVEGKEDLVLTLSDSRGNIKVISIERRNLLYWSSMKTRIRVINPKYAKPQPTPPTSGDNQ
jgi:hypothetical protein